MSEIYDLQSRYTIPRPGVPVVVWVLGVVVLLGLGALGWAAFVAFRQVHPWGQAALFAGLIEVGAVAEAWALVRGKGWQERVLPVLGAGVVLVVSGRYNLVQVRAESAAAGVGMAWMDEYALALGPLLVMLSMALMLGRYWGEWEQAVEAWARERQVWVEKEMLRLERREDRRKEREESLRKDDRKDDRKVPGVYVVSSVDTGEGAESSGESSGDVAVRDWRKVPVNLHVRIAAMTTREIMDRFGLDARTALNWQTRARRAVGNGYHVEGV